MKSRMLSVLFCLSLSAINANRGGPPGSDRTRQGCIGSAGYSWCRSTQMCYRPFESSCPSGPSGPNGPMRPSGNGKKWKKNKNIGHGGKKKKFQHPKKKSGKKNRLHPKKPKKKPKHPNRPRVLAGYTKYTTGGCIGRNELGTSHTITARACAIKCNGHHAPKCVSFEYEKHGTTCKLSSSCASYSMTRHNPKDPFDWYLKKTGHTAQPSASPTSETASPSASPSISPATKTPSVSPSASPSSSPTTGTPSVSPSDSPSRTPSASPSTT